MKIEYKTHDDGYELISAKEISGHFVVPREYNGKPITRLGFNSLHCDYKKSASIYVGNNIKYAWHSVVRGRAIVYCESDKCPDGQWGDGWCEYSPVYYSVNETNFLSENGFEFVIHDNNAVLTHYIGDEEEIIVPQKICLSGKKYTVKTIGESAFEHNEKIKSVKIPKSIKEIKENAFQGCKELEILDISEGLTKIGSDAFDDTYSLKYIFLPRSLKSIGYHAFYELAQFVYIPHEKKPKSYEISSSIRPNVICGVSKVDCFEIEDFVFVDREEYAELLHYKGKNSIVKIPANVDRDGKHLAVTHLADYAFSGCSAVEVVVPESITHFGLECFRKANTLSMRSLFLPANLKKLSYNTISTLIYDCGQLTIYTQADDFNLIDPDFDISDDRNRCDYKCRVYRVDKDGIYLDSGGCMYVFQNNESTLTLYKGSAEILHIPDLVNGYPVTEISPYAFSNRHNNLKEVRLPNDLKKIGRNAFKHCNHLRSIKVPVGVKRIEKETFNICEALESAELPGVEFIGKEAFGGCKKLEKVILGAIEIIDSEAFRWLDNLKSISFFPNTLKSIGQKAFCGCGSLNKLFIPKAAKVAGNAFESCWHMQVFFEDDESNRRFNGFYCNAVYYDVKSDDIKVSECGLEYLIIDNYATIVGYVGELKSVVIPSKIVANDKEIAVIAVGDCAFFKSKIENVSIQAGIKSIGKSAFYKSKVKNVELANGLEKIGDFAFSNTDIKNMRIPDSITEIGTFALACENMRYLILPKSVSKFGGNLHKNTKLFARVETQPIGWSKDWQEAETVTEYNDGGGEHTYATAITPVVWGFKGDDTDIPIE